MPDPTEQEDPEVEPVEPEDVAGDDPEEAVPGEEALGDPGKRALEATKARYRAERQKRLDLEEKLREATKGDQPDADTIRADAERAANQRANQRIVRAEVKGAAAALFNDPADALQFIDISSFDVDDDGEVDPDEINAALSELLAKKPYLAKISAPRGGGKRIPEVPADPAHKPSTPLSHAERIAAAQAAGDLKTVIALQNDLLTSNN